MSQATQTVFCAKCDLVLEETPNIKPEDRKPCPGCGATSRKFAVSVEATLVTRASVSYKAKHPGAKKPHAEGFSGHQIHRKSGRWMEKQRLIDRDQDKYKELVTDSETGQIVHQCEEPLSKHIGHGSARKDMQATDLKKKHEKAVADQLLKNIGSNATFKRDGNDQGEPDVLYDIDGRVLGIEVATAYYDNSDARQAWEHARGNRQMPQERYELRDEGVLKDPDAIICDKVQGELEDKCAKQYQGAEEVWLCIEQRALLLSDEESEKKCVETLTIPAGHHFARIYLFFRDGGGYRAIQLA